MSAVARLRFRKRSKVRLFLAALRHRLETKHEPGYDVEWDGASCYFVCRVCGARLLYGVLELPAAKR